MSDPNQNGGVDVTGVPQDAIRRLAELKPGAPGGIFTSDLSVNEFLLVREAGFRPLGLVLGSSIYHVGVQFGRWGKNQELDVLSQAMYHARELAMTRMEAEASALGADGVVGVRLDVEMKEFGADGVVVKSMEMRVRERECPVQEHRRDHIVEATTIGTAIARFSAAARAAERPSLAILSLDPKRGQASGVQLGAEPGTDDN